MRRTVLMAAILGWGILPSFAEDNFSYQDLPADVRALVEDVRDRCKVQPDYKLYSAMDGIRIIHLNGDTARDILVDNEELCGGIRSAGLNCTNRGCDLTIWKEIGPRRWRQVFQDHLYQKFISVDENDWFAAIVASIYAGSKECHPPPGAEFTSGRSCDVIIRYKHGEWKYERLN
jgi:hypothetical protein